MVDVNPKFINLFFNNEVCLMKKLQSFKQTENSISTSKQKKNPKLKRKKV